MTSEVKERPIEVLSTFEDKEQRHQVNYNDQLNVAQVCAQCSRNSECEIVSRMNRKKVLCVPFMSPKRGQAYFTKIEEEKA